MVVCSCRDIRDSHFNSKEELATRVLEDDYCCGKCLEEFLFDGPEIGSIDVIGMPRLIDWQSAKQSNCKR